MNYQLLPDPALIHDAFRRRFTLPYGAFCHTHADRLASLPAHFRRGYTQAYFDRLPYSDRLCSEFEVLSFEEALDRLRCLDAAIFLTNPPGGLIRDYARLGTEQLWAAETTGAELAEAIREDWFRQYALWDQGMYDPDPLFGSEIFAFAPDWKTCIVFTHETDGTELPETRICLIFRSDT